MKGVILFQIILILAVGISSCKSEEEKAIENMIRKHLHAIEIENLELLEETIHPNSPSRAQSLAITKKLWQIYDVKYRLDEFEVVEINGNEAVVRTTMTVKKVRGPAFQDNQITMLNVVRKDTDGKWKIYSSKIEKIKAIN